MEKLTTKQIHKYSELSIFLILLSIITVYFGYDSFRVYISGQMSGAIYFPLYFMGVFAVIIYYAFNKNKTYDLISILLLYTFIIMFEVALGLNLAIFVFLENKSLLGVFVLLLHFIQLFYLVYKISLVSDIRLFFDKKNVLFHELLFGSVVIIILYYIFSEVFFFAWQITLSLLSSYSISFSHMISNNIFTRGNNKN